MNAAESQHVRSNLLHTDDQYRQLATRHQELESRLHQLTNKHYLTASEEFEEVTLKKRKLALKDQMEAIARGIDRSP